MEHLNKTYPGGKVAVEDFNLEIEKGEFVSSGRLVQVKRPRCG